MKNKALLLGVAALGVLATASCGGDEGYVAPDLNGRTINCYVNYCGKSGVTFTGKALNGSFKNPIDGKTYVKGDLLPMWDQVQKNLNVTIHDSVYDVDGYVSVKDDAQYTSLSGYDQFNKLDFVMMSNKNANSFAKDSKLVDISKYLDKMPNYKAFLDQNQTIKKEMTNSDGQMFMLPYFDGLNAAEHMFLMNTELVEKLLDEANPTYDETAVTNGGAYQPTIKTDADYKVGISVNGKLQDLQVKASTNPVKRQNDLATKTGKTYAEALKAHLQEAYGANVGAGKTYSKLSEIYTSEAACYNTDDLVALMRVAVNNSKYLGHEGQVQGFIPREAKDSRIDSVLWLMQIWGIQGIRGTAEKDALYFDKDGQLQDGRVQSVSYDGLTKLHQLYQEGLIVKAFDNSTSGSYTAKYLTGKEGAALMMFDYNTTQTANNKKDDNGNGKDDSEYFGTMPVLPPLTKWANDNITDSKYALSRYIESSRANKGSGTVIPKHATEEDDIAACQFADYFFSEEGAKLQDYGPEAYSEGTVTIAGVQYPAYKKVLLDNAVTSGLGWNDYCRTVMGTTQGIGHVRTTGVEYQFMHVSGRKGQANLESAVASGAVIVARSDRAAGFAASVPSQWSSNAEATEIQALVDFWARGTGDSVWRKVVLNGWEASDVTRASLEALFETSNRVYLEHYRTLLNSSSIE